ncbi:MAG: MarR family transcriptional regulator, partial [Cyclobacteriaceae bacterium]
RSIRIYLTETGKKKKEVSRQVVKLFNKAVREKIAEKDLKVFFSVITDINEIIEKNSIYKQ